MLGIMALWTRRTVAVACSRLVLLVTLHFALCFFPGWQAHDARHHGRFGPEGQLRHGAHVQTAQTVESPQLQSIQVVDISFAVQRQSLMVQTVRQIIDILQLLYKVVDVPVSMSSRFTSPS